MNTIAWVTAAYALGAGVLVRWRHDHRIDLGGQPAAMLPLAKMNLTGCRFRCRRGLHAGRGGV